MPVRSVLFTLVNAEDPEEVVAFGMEVTVTDPRSGRVRRVAATYMPDPSGDHHDMHGLHTCAEAARELRSPKA